MFWEMDATLTSEASAVLITGVAGLVGSYLAEALLAQAPMILAPCL